MPEVYVFWTQYKRPDVRKWKALELHEGRLRQGWGGPGTQLVEAGLQVSNETWIPRVTSWIRSWDVSESRKRRDIETAESRHTILSRMLNFQQGDLLVIPRMPTDDEVTLALVTGGYRWEPVEHPAARAHGLPDFGHVVEVDASRLVTIPREGTADACLLAGKFTCYRSAISPVASPVYAQTAWRIYRNAQT